MVATAIDHPWSSARCNGLRLRDSLLSILLALSLGACAGQPERYRIELMPVPELYAEEEFNPLVDDDPATPGFQRRVFYATDRAPASGRDRYAFYSDERGRALRLGTAMVQFGDDESLTFEEARRISLMKDRPGDFSLEVLEIEEFGALERTIGPFNTAVERSAEPGARFAAAVDAELSNSRRPEVYIYVHGFNVEFEDPVLVAAELWHFLGYDGAFIGFSWPATPSLFAYESDLEDAENAARMLVALVLHLARDTQAEKIHVIGYSAGTRVVSRMLADLGKYTFFRDPQEIAEGLRLGNVMLLASDIDRDILTGFLLDGALRVPDALTIYQSRTDIALGAARLAFRRERAGQVAEHGLDGEAVESFLEAYPMLRLIDVTGAAGTRKAKGHGYFRASPWVSSDLLMTLLHGLPPADRGLVREGADSLAWTFPADYRSRLRAALQKLQSLPSADRP